jgi:hypothetical protein
MAAKIYRLRIGGDGKEFEAEGDKAFVLAMAKLYGPGTMMSLCCIRGPIHHIRRIA